jgi:phospholipase/lecithinase/hemolysin
MHGSRRLRAGLAGASALTAIVGLSYVTPSAAAARLAPAPDRAARGGAVIVMLKTQHSGMDERTQARALKAATESNQASIVAAIKAAGGTNVLQLTEPNAVAATLSASAVASLRANPKVALSSPL